MDRKTFKASVGASVLAAVLVIIFVQPVLRIIWKIFISVSSYTVTYLRDLVYKNAALGERNWVVVLIFIILCSTMIFVTLGIMSRNKMSQIIQKLSKTFHARYTRIIKAVDYIIWIVCTLSIIYLAIYVFADLQLNTSFNQRLNVLKPHITLQKEEEIVAMWATMENRSDYEQIVRVMENVAKENNLKLPRLLLE